jgi:hypothetical protein
MYNKKTLSNNTIDVYGGPDLPQMTQTISSGPVVVARRLRKII